MVISVELVREIWTDCLTTPQEALETPESEADFMFLEVERMQLSVARLAANQDLILDLLSQLPLELRYTRAEASYTNSCSIGVACGDINNRVWSGSLSVAQSLLFLGKGIGAVALFEAPNGGLRYAIVSQYLPPS